MTINTIPKRSRRRSISLAVATAALFTAGCDLTDTDLDGVPDRFEIARGWNPADGDVDDNGLADGVQDIDFDGYSDWVEVNLGTDPEDPFDPRDADLDRLPDFYEVGVGTDPLDPDSDEDGLWDGTEVGWGPTFDMYRVWTSLEFNWADPLNPSDPAPTDTDGGGNPDWYEVLLGTDPLTIDPNEATESIVGCHRGEVSACFEFGDFDVDGLWDLLEVEIGTDLGQWDSDGDGFGDGHEVSVGFDPLDADSLPI